MTTTPRLYVRRESEGEVQKAHIVELPSRHSTPTTGELPMTAIQKMAHELAWEYTLEDIRLFGA